MTSEILAIAILVAVAVLVAVPVIASMRDDDQ